jgi:hypothetical protein
MISSRTTGYHAPNGPISTFQKFAYAEILVWAFLVGI